MYPLLKPFLFRMEPERAHEVTLSLLSTAQKTGFVLPALYSNQHKPINVMGIDFKNPVGLAAGLDKNGDYIDALAALGFGFIEIGTITPKPQVGNHRPRLFRLPQANAIINRMGFNNAGVHAMVENIERAKYQGVLGINIGKNATTLMANAADDYVYCLQQVYNHASYVTVNISSPNTKDLRSLQKGDALAKLLDVLKNEQSKLATANKHYVPMVLKVAPDLDKEQIEHISKQIQNYEFDGLIVSNTSISRIGVNHLPQSQETGGLSGAPISDMSDEALKQFHQVLQGKVPLIGVGGIDSGEKAAKKQNLGASLVQIYSGLIYKGPALIGECVDALS